MKTTPTNLTVNFIDDKKINRSGTAYELIQAPKIVQIGTKLEGGGITVVTATAYLVEVKDENEPGGNGFKYYTVFPEQITLLFYEQN